MEKYKNNYDGKMQFPINSGFDRNTTADEVIKGVDLNGKIAIVTGGHSGLGLETTRILVAAGATVIVGARDIEKAAENLEGIANVELVSLELTDSGSIESFAAKFIASARPLHFLFNNAGIMWVPLQRDSRGYESQFSTNHLGHFHLTARLWPALKQAEGARVVNTSSWGHHNAPVDFEDINFIRREYETMRSYGQSKTANVLFALELDERGKPFGVRSYAIHPGVVQSTGLARSRSLEDMKKLGMLDADGKPVLKAVPGAKTVQQGISTQIWCAVSAQLNDIGGVYCENTDIAVLDVNFDPTVDWRKNVESIKGVMPYALEKESAKKLWTISEEMSGVVFNLS
ncbi:SDR family NAD(P)-dependent oxidoreductase [Pedobacter psychrodurus]|uniref:SDR family NAD(P)-dependent oxidoreductase n=1 Tax=Pedobacter psychrodurus TaxID=2530456 RepID=UPI00293044B0|nr:SDR family NAD(P)-dependent oxidoreductase [Pedobacter psychrodurus]